MDPITIATTAAGIVKSCYMVTATIYTFVDDSRNVDTHVDDLLREIQGLSRAAEAVGSSWNQNPMIITAQAGVNGNLWGSVGTSLEDCQITLARLNSKLDELKKGSSFGRGFLRKPTKVVMLNMRLKDIVAFKQQIQSYNSAMQSALLMINVCLSLNSNSSQESVVQILSGLKTQIGHLRMETSRQGALVTGFTSPEVAKDNKRMTQNLQSLIQHAEALHSSASTVVSDDRSTVWGGSILGDPLNDDQYSSIKNWIPPPAISEEGETTGKAESTSFLDSAIGGDQTVDQDSDADSDIERHLWKRYGEVAMTNFKQKNYPKAESFFRKVAEMNAENDASEDEIRETSVMLAYSCALQAKWEEAERILLPIAMEKGLSDIIPLHGLYAFSLVYVAKPDYETAIKYCKRASGGFRKILGKFSSNYFDSMALLAHIYDLKEDSVSAEGCRTFLPTDYNTSIEMNPSLYLEKAFLEATENPSQQMGASTPSLTIPEPQSTKAPRSTSADQAKSPFLSPDTGGAVHTRSRSVESLTNTVERINLETNHRRSNSATPSQPFNTHQTQIFGQDMVESPSQPQTDTVYDMPDASKPLTPVSSNSEFKKRGSFSNLNTPLQAQKPTKLIVAVDFGLTETAVAWCFTSSGSLEPYAQNHKSVGIFDDWPSSTSRREPVEYGSQKVPTILYYDLSPKIVGWGRDEANALTNVGYPKPGVTKLQWFRSHLMIVENSYMDLVNLPSLPNGKSALDVVVDFLSQIQQTIQSYLIKILGESYAQEEQYIHYCFTLPFICNAAAKESLRKAIIQSRFLKDEKDSRFSFIPEGEAAVIASIKSGLLQLQVHDVVLVVGCGMGIVELAAYKLDRISPCSLSEFTAVGGDSCGATAINRNFSNLLRIKIRKMKLPEMSKTAGKVYAKAITDFDNRIRNDFKNNGQKWKVHVDIGGEWPQAGIAEGDMTFTNEEIYAQFEPVVNLICKLVKDQITACQVKNGLLKNILITGPFGNNEYLLQQIKSHCPPQYQSKFVRPVDGETITAKGAAIAATERCNISPTAATNLSTTICSRNTYVLQMPIKTRAEPHTRSDACRPFMHCSDGVDRRFDSALIILRRGQSVSNFQLLRFTVTSFQVPGSSLFFSNAVYSKRSMISPSDQMVIVDPKGTLKSNRSPEDLKFLDTKITNLAHIRLEDYPFRKFRTDLGVAYMVEFDLVVELDNSIPESPFLVIKSDFDRREFGSLRIKVETESFTRVLALK